MVSSIYISKGFSIICICIHKYIIRAYGCLWCCFAHYTQSCMLWYFMYVHVCMQLWLVIVFFCIGFSTGGLLGLCSLSLMECVPPALSATALGIGDCSTHLGLLHPLTCSQTCIHVHTFHTQMNTYAKPTCTYQIHCSAQIHTVLHAHTNTCTHTACSWSVTTGLHGIQLCC